MLGTTASNTETAENMGRPGTTCLYQARCEHALTDSQADDAGSIPVIRSKKHLVRCCLRHVVIRCRASPVPRPLVKSGRYRRSSLRWPHERPGREAVAVGIEPRSQAKKLMFPQADVSAVGRAVWSDYGSIRMQATQQRWDIVYAGAFDTERDDTRRCTHSPPSPTRRPGCGPRSNEYSTTWGPVDRGNYVRRLSSPVNRRRSARRARTWRPD